MKPLLTINKKNRGWGQVWIALFFLMLELFAAFRVIKFLIDIIK